jgi:hypothetical protein
LQARTEQPYESALVDLDMGWVLRLLHTSSKIQVRNTAVYVPGLGTPDSQPLLRRLSVLLWSGKFWGGSAKQQRGSPRIPSSQIPGSPSPSGPDTMAGSLVSRSPTCLACLRRLAQPFGSNSGSASAVSLVQVRAKSNRLRPKDQGVVVRLLEDIPKFGRKGRLSCCIVGHWRTPIEADSVSVPR